MVETLAKALAESKGAPGAEALVAQIALLQEEVESLSHEVRELRNATDFDRKLLAERAGSAKGSRSMTS